MVGECVESIPADALVPAKTSAIDLFTSLSTPFGASFFVEDEGEVVGFINAFGFMKVPFRLCLFAVTIELEEAALQVALLSRNEAWRALAPRRQGKARRLWSLLSNRPLPDSATDPWGLIEVTDFADKVAMITRSGLVEGWSEDRLTNTFRRAQLLRNTCAHTNTSHQYSVMHRLDDLRATTVMPNY